jgi:hypothetical protein
MPNGIGLATFSPENTGIAAAIDPDDSETQRAFAGKMIDGGDMGRHLKIAIWFLATGVFFSVGSPICANPNGVRLDNVISGVNGREVEGVKILTSRESLAGKTGAKQTLKGMIRIVGTLPPSRGHNLALRLELTSVNGTASAGTLFLKWYYALRREKSLVEFTNSAKSRVFIIPVPQDSTEVLKKIKFEITMNSQPEMPKVSLIETEISLELTSDPLQAMREITVQGRADRKAAEIAICLKAADGGITRRNVSCRNGEFTATWKNPPLSPGGWSSIYAESVDDGHAAAYSLPLPLFGYRSNYDFAWLRVKGQELVTSAESRRGERPFIPVGIGYCRDVILSVEDESAVRFCKSQNLNTIRLPFYTNLFNNEPGKEIEIEAHIRDFIDPVVKAAKRNDMYVILDAHHYFHKKIEEKNARGVQKGVRRWNEREVQKWIDNWVRVATAYADEPNILGYELLNEPHSLAPEVVRDLYKRCLKAIRKVDKRHIVIVGTRDWCHARALEDTWGTEASTLDAPYNNIVFSFHDYPEDNHPWIVQEHVLTFRDRHRVPVMCTEFGATHWSKSETVCREFQAGMLTLFAQEKIGWMIWALKRLENNPRSPYNVIDKVGFGPPHRYDSCSYSDLWPPAAKIMGSAFPEPK